jgi:hypothetical protein
MFDRSDTVFRRRNVTRRCISNTVLQPRYNRNYSAILATLQITSYMHYTVFDEGTESADIATNENILLLDEYSKVKLF